MNQDTRTIPAAIGAAIQGGFFAGLINVGADTFALVVAPKDGGETVSAWNTDTAAVIGAGSYNDGMANTNAMNEAGSPLAQWARSLRIEQFDDWYIPSRDELELMYRNLKPSTRENDCSFRDGENPCSVPPGFAYTETMPAQTTVSAFVDGGAQAFATKWYWSSTQCAAGSYDAWFQFFSGGGQGYGLKGSELRVRAVRRFKI